MEDEKRKVGEEVKKMEYVQNLGIREIAKTNSNTKFSFDKIHIVLSSSTWSQKL
jgi:hypothetical protein